MNTECPNMHHVKAAFVNVQRNHLLSLGESLLLHGIDDDITYRVGRELDAVVKPAGGRYTTPKPFVEERKVVGLEYIPCVTVSHETSTLEYLSILKELTGTQMEAEAASMIYRKMLVGVKHLLWQNGKVNETFAMKVEAIDILVAYSAKEGILSLELPSGKLTWSVVQ